MNNKFLLLDLYILLYKHNFKVSFVRSSKVVYILQKNKSYHCLDEKVDDVKINGYSHERDDKSLKAMSIDKNHAGGSLFTLKRIFYILEENTLNRTKKYNQSCCNHALLINRLTLFV